MDRGVHQHSGRIWYGSHVFEDGTLEKFDEDCQFPCCDFSNHSPRSMEDCLFAYNFNDIDHISEQLGIPWDRTKDQPFGCMTTYIGFIWDLSSLQVSISLAKKEKYLCSIEEWKSRCVHVLNDVKKLYGKLLHACLVILSG